MCGRFVRAKASETYGDLFGVRDVPDFSASYNIAPTQPVLAARIESDALAFVLLRWGLIPSWAKDKKMAQINARADTVAEKPMFRSAFKKRRCLILADGYYEWKTTGKQKQPFFFRLKDDGPFTFAGVWETWKGEGEPLETCAIITTDANDLTKAVHNRMPVILTGDEALAWIDPDVDPEKLKGLLQPYSPDKMTYFAVDPGVGNVKNNSPECIEPAP